MAEIRPKSRWRSPVFVGSEAPERLSTDVVEQQVTSETLEAVDRRASRSASANRSSTIRRLTV